MSQRPTPLERAERRVAKKPSCHGAVWEQVRLQPVIENGRIISYQGEHRFRFSLPLELVAQDIGRLWLIIRHQTRVERTLCTPEHLHTTLIVEFNRLRSLNDVPGFKPENACAEGELQFNGLSIEHDEKTGWCLSTHRTRDRAITATSSDNRFTSLPASGIQAHQLIESFLHAHGLERLYRVAGTVLPPRLQHCQLSPSPASIAASTP